MTKHQATVGIDYSITCPCICISTKTITEFHFIKNETRFAGEWNFGEFRFVGHKYPEYESDMERYDLLSDIFLTELNRFVIVKVNIEAYSYGSSGKVFNLAENCGLLKYKIWKQFGITPKSIAPMTLKKIATGKGAGKKDVMFKAWESNFPHVDIHAIMGIKKTKNVGNPISDIVDAYYLSRG